MIGSACDAAWGRTPAQLSNESDAMTISRFFRDRLGAPLVNDRWSWGAISPSTGQVYLRVWDDELGTLKGRRCVRITDGKLPDPADLGDRERHAHVQEIERGVKPYCVVLTAVDPRETPRKIKSFDETALLVGGELIKDSEGRFWLEDAGRCPIPAPGEPPDVAPSRPPRGERPRLVKRVERGASEGVADRSTSEGPSPAVRPPVNRSGSRPADRPARREPSRAARAPGSPSEGPRESLGVRKTPGHGAREHATAAGAPRRRRPVREPALQSLHRTLDTPEGVFGAGESRTDNSRERHRARETALQLLYQWDVGRIGAGDLDDALDLFWTVHPAPAPRRELAVGLARGAVAALPEIDALIARHTDNWRSERLAVVDRLIMRLAVYELLFERTPAAVVINEALELAKTFSGERAVAFVNGVLDAVRRAITEERDRSSALGT